MLCEIVCWGLSFVLVLESATVYLTTFFRMWIAAMDMIIIPSEINA